MNMFFFSFFFFVIQPFIKEYRYLFSYYTNINVVFFFKLSYATLFCLLHYKKHLLFSLNKES